MTLIDHARATRNFARDTLGNIATSFAAVTPGIRPLPDFIIIGAQKAGTTSLFRYLSEHPHVAPALKKEVHFFDLNYAKGLNWYRSNFPSMPYIAMRKKRLGGPVITGEASPYYLFHPFAAERASKAVPNARLIVMLRNPVDRAFSHYQHQLRKGRETRDFARAIDEEPSILSRELDRMRTETGYESEDYATFSYVTRGIYVDQINEWLEYFQRDQLLVIDADSFFQDPAEPFGRVIDFLGLPPCPLQDTKAHNAGSYQDAPDSAVRRQLLDFYAPHNDRLYALLGRSFDWNH